MLSHFVELNFSFLPKKNLLEVCQIQFQFPSKKNLLEVRKILSRVYDHMYNEQHKDHQSEG